MSAPPSLLASPPSHCGPSPNDTTPWCAWAAGGLQCKVAVCSAGGGGMVPLEAGQHSTGVEACGTVGCKMHGRDVQLAAVCRCCRGSCGPGPAGGKAGEEPCRKVAARGGPRSTLCLPRRPAAPPRLQGWIVGAVINVIGSIMINLGTNITVRFYLAGGGGRFFSVAPPASPPPPHLCAEAGPQQDRRCPASGAAPPPEVSCCANASCCSGLCSRQGAKEAQGNTTC